MVNCIIHHDVDTDGYMGLAVCSKWCSEHHENEAQLLIGAHYEQGWKPEIPQNEPYRLIIVDYHLPAEELKEHLENPNCEEVHWYDHHASAIREAHLAGITDEFGQSCHYKLKCLVDSRDSGCLNAWKALFPDSEVPLAVHLASIYDTWNRTHEDWVDGLDFNLGLRVRYGKLNELIDLLEYEGFTLDIIEEGRIIQDYQDIVKTRQAWESSFPLEWRGLKFLAMNASGNSLYLQDITHEKDIAGFLLFSFVPGHGWKVSMFGNEHYEGDVDLSKIAVSYGGGGHKKACGFYVKALPFELPVEA